MIALIVLAYHLVALAGIAVNLAAFPVLRPGPPAADRPRVSLLVPARDEARRLPDALPGLLAQPADEILILDDGSSDGTAAVAAGTGDPRVRVLTGAPRPAGWVGKNWACHQLAEAATGEVLVFCDADVTLAPGALDAVWARLRDADVFSVFPRQRTDTVGERLLVPLIDETLLGFLPYPLLRLPVPAAAAANGQLLAFHRSTYERIGGHRSVSGAVVEDLALARRARRLGLRLRLALGGDLVSARMYDGYGPAVRGFGKSLRGAYGNSRVITVAAAAWRVVAYTVPWLAGGPIWWLCATLGLVERLLVNAKTGRRAWAEAALVPITPVAVLPAYVLALRRRVRWKGRAY